MSFMFNLAKGLFTCLLLLVFLFSQNYAFASGQELFEWELRVIVEKANIHLEPGENSTVVITIPQSSILRSYEKEGEWFRVIFQQESGIVVIGYIHSSQVQVMKEKVDQKINFWGAESEFFKGIGLTVKVSVGFNRIAAGEINAGIRGTVDYYKYLISYFGHYFDSEVKPFHSGFDFGVDAIYSLTSHIGIGLGLSYVQWGSSSWLPLAEPPGYLRRLDSQARVKAYPVRLGAFVTLPIFRKINVTFNAGPTYYFVRQFYNMSYPPYAVIQKTSGQGLGFHGGIGLELEWSSRATLFIEYQGRYAKFNTFEGTEENVFSGGRLKEEGPLSFMEYIEGSETGRRLTVVNEEMLLSPDVKLADFDLSGFAIRIGAKVKF
ncbi:MAG: outer membrane beta-barrel protein [Candidatus Aminicenantaceae bacterium]